MLTMDTRNIEPGLQKLTEREAKELIRLLQTEFQLEPRILFSSRLTSMHSACYKRPVLMMLPSEDTRMLTEARVLHEIAHVIDIEASRIRPHSSSFEDILDRVKKAYRSR